MKPIQRRHDFSGKCTLKKENILNLRCICISVFDGRTPKWVIFTDPCTKGVFLGLHQFNGTLLQLHLFLCKKNTKKWRDSIFFPLVNLQLPIPFMFSGCPSLPLKELFIVRMPTHRGTCMKGLRRSAGSKESINQLLLTSQKWYE